MILRIYYILGIYNKIFIYEMIYCVIWFKICKKVMVKIRILFEKMFRDLLDYFVFKSLYYKEECYMKCICIKYFICLREEVEL